MQHDNPGFRGLLKSKKETNMNRVAVLKKKDAEVRDNMQMQILDLVCKSLSRLSLVRNTLPETYEDLASINPY
jgi:hypothetical protein